MSQDAFLQLIISISLHFITTFYRGRGESALTKDAWFTNTFVTDSTLLCKLSLNHLTISETFRKGNFKSTHRLSLHFLNDKSQSVKRGLIFLSECKVTKRICEFEVQPAS